MEYETTGAVEDSRTSVAMRERDASLVFHPIWADRGYKVFLRSPADVRSRIRYVEDNPVKEGLGPQQWEFVPKFED